MRIATKGVVQLFNTVSEYQTDQQKAVVQEIHEKQEKYSKILSDMGKDQVNSSNKKIIEKLQNKKSSWSVLNGEEESEYDSDGNIKIKDFDE